MFQAKFSKILSPQSPEIDLSQISLNEFNFHQLPTIWSYPLTFEKLILQESSVEALFCWRSLLCFWVLAPNYAIDLKILPFQIRNSEQFFFKPLQQTLPNQLDLNAIMWCIQYQSHPIALSWPSLWLCPAQDLSCLTNKAPWLENDIWQDPLPILNQNEQWALLYCLSQIYASSIKYSSKVQILTHTGQQVGLASLLLDFIQDLILSLHQKEDFKQFQWSHLSSIDYLKTNFLSQFLPYISENSPPNFKVTYSSLLNNFASSQGRILSDHERLFSMQIMLPGQVNDNSILTLSHQLPNSSKEVKHAIIISKQFQSLIPAYERVFDIYTLAQLLNITEHETNRDYLAGQFYRDLKWLNEEDFFCEHLFFLPFTNALNTYDHIWGYFDITYKQQNLLPLLPFKKVIFDYFKPLELLEAISFEQEKDLVHVYLNLRLGPDKKLFCLKKTYLINPQHILLNVPVIKVWPNILSPLLQTYHCYFNAYGQTDNTFFIEPCTHMDVKVRSYDFQRNLCRQDAIDESNVTSSEIDMEIFQVHSFPDSFLCYRDSCKQDYIGFFLVKSPQTLIPLNHQVEVAVDLGTTNTNVFLKSFDTIFPINFLDSRMLAASYSIIDPNIYEDFIASDTIHSPFLTLYHVLNETPFLEAILDGHIYFIETIHSYQTFANLKSELKWGSEHNSQYLLAFIKQLCMQAVIEALGQEANQISFCFSFPHAFSKTDLQTYQRAISIALTDIKAHFCTAIETNNIQFLSEGIASAYFFASGHARLPKANFYNGAYILDIGGGTTDITIIQKKEHDNEVRLTSSLMLAGREIFLKPLSLYPQVLLELGIDNSLVKRIQGLSSRMLDHQASPIDDMNRNYLSIDSNLFSEIEAILQEYQQTIFEALQFRWAMSNVKPFIACMAFAVAGLFYYLGLLTEFLLEHKNYEQRGLPMFFIGGNGSKIFQWFFAGRDKPSYLNLFYRSYTLGGSLSLNSNEKELDIITSPTVLGSKPEVVFGMLSSKENQSFTRVNLKPIYILGEDINTNTNKHLNPLDWVSKEQFSDFIFDKSMPMHQMKKFMDLYFAWLQQFCPDFAKSINSAKLFQQGRQVFIEKMQHMQTFFQAEQSINIRDEHVVFLQELKTMYSLLQKELYS